jgi:hypothetical protein
MALSAVSNRTNSKRQIYITLTVQYRDGLTLNYLFERSARVADLMVAIHRAGRVRKVVLWDEMRSSGRVRNGVR